VPRVDHGVRDVSRGGSMCRLCHAPGVKVQYVAEHLRVAGSVSLGLPDRPAYRPAIKQLCARHTSRCGGCVASGVHGMRGVSPGRSVYRLYPVSVQAVQGVLLAWRTWAWPEW
jgi:hypothetical protein